VSFRLLLDEMTEAGLAEYCRTLGHDTERVVSVADLGAGSDDGEIVAYAEREHRLLVTYDDDFLAGHDALGRIGVLFQPDDRTPPFETATIIDAIADHVDQETIREHDEPFHLTTDWL
jgi:uncharacterized protein with PIN domain